MKKISLIIFTVFFTAITFAQNKEKIKGSKIVTTEKPEITAFDQLEIEDNVEVFLVKGEKSGLEIETDDNLHAVINHQIYGTTLRINTSKEVSSFKKFEIRITYTDSLKLITIKHESKVNAISELNLKNITIKTFDFSKSFINANSPNFVLMTNDKSKVELNLKGADSFVEMSKNSTLKALITSNKLKFDMYQKSNAVIEGDVNEMKLRLDNDAKYEGKNMASKMLDLTAEGNTDCSIHTNRNLAISAAGKTEISIFGEPKIEIKKFADEAKLIKKILK